MKFRLQLVIEEDGHLGRVREIACLTREALSAETLGLRLEEGKQILSELQAQMVGHQVEQFIEEVAGCEACQKRLARKDSKQITMRTLYGKLKLNSPRFKRCQCRGQQGGRKSFSPLAERLPERTSPELKYLQTKWAALASYGMSVRFMEEAFPLQANTFASRQHVAAVATRLEDELGKEQPSFIEGIPLIWEQMPDPEPPVTVGIDGGFIHARDGDNRKAGWIEVIVGKSQRGRQTFCLCQQV